MNAANKVTISRLFLIPLFIIFLFIFGEKGKVLSLLLFLIASFSDWLDGYIARKKEEVTTTGKIMDPVADKILVYGALICFIYLHIIPFWMVIILMARDFLIMALRVELAVRGNVLAASYMAKLKTVFEYAAIFFAFLFLLLPSGLFQLVMKICIYSTLGTAVIFALASGIQYTIEEKKYLK